MRVTLGFIALATAFSSGAAIAQESPASNSEIPFSSDAALPPAFASAHIIHPILGVKRSRSRLGSQQSSARSALVGSYSWSGGVLTSGAAAYGNTSFKAALGEIVVPTAQPAFGVCSGRPVLASQWVGLDGVGSNDIVQAGTETDAICVGGKTSTNYYVWYEWYPGGAYEITNLPLAPGNVVLIYVSVKSKTSAQIYILNETTNEAAGLQVSLPAGSTFVGSSAEWIVERPSVDSQATMLANDTKTYIGGAVAFLNNSVSSVVWSANPQAGMGSYLYEMLDGSNSPISAPAAVSPGEYVISTVGSAR